MSLTRLISAAVLCSSIAACSANGTPGAAGSIGATGATGATGPTGGTGAAGLAGATGAAGVDGVTGPTGATGAAGNNGVDGIAGAPGANGATGSVGAAGAAGATGATGLIWKGAWSAATSYAIDDAVSSGGAAYIAIAANTASQPPGAGWSLLASGGATGATGATGAVGGTGNNGSNGAAGNNGTSAATTALAAGDSHCTYGGIQVSSASSSVYVCNGAPGPVGATGATGGSGTNGASGASVVSAALSSGDANCPSGGSRFTAGSTVTYACNGAPTPAGTIAFRGSTGTYNISSGNNVVGGFTVAFNPGGGFDGNQFTAPVAGLYAFSSAVHAAVSGAAANYYTQLWVNGAGVDLGSRGAAAGINPISVNSDLLSLNAGDVVQLIVYTDTAGTSFAYFSGFLVH